MEAIHVKNLEKYHPGYKDRSLQWCKIYFSMVNADPNFEMADEIDKWRFIHFVILELQTKKPIPIDSEYLTRKGFQLKKRPISATLQMLHNSLVVVTLDTTLPCPRVEKSRVEKNKSRVDSVTEKTRNTDTPPKVDFIQELKNNPAFEGIDVDFELKKAQRWLASPRGRGRRFTKQFFINWLNRADAEVKVDQKPDVLERLGVQ